MTSLGSVVRERRFAQVDVFTAQALRGNPLAVVVDAEGLDDATMAAFARWTQLSETTFLLPPTDPAADYRVRIFTPGGELPFAGHPTLGSCRVWLDHGGQAHRADEVVQQCGVGLVRLRRELETGRLAFQAPALRRRDVDAGLLAAVRAALGLAADEVLAAQWLDNGPEWLTLRLPSAERVLAVQPDQGALKSLAKVGLVGAYPAGGEADVELRAFAAPLGVAEDPVTGSLNASVAQWLMAQGVLPERYVASQGRALGRAGRVYLQRSGEGLWVGGDVAACIAGTVRL